jgi:hypothetical protein
MRGFRHLCGFFLLVLAVDWCFARFARSHFIPARKLATALRESPARVVITGDSRMVAALDRDAFEAGWQAASGHSAGIADLSLGGVSIAGQAVAVRRYFEQGGKAAIVLLGTVPEALRARPADPESWIGNEAVIVWWSHASDGWVHFKGRTLDPDTADAWFRFLVYRMSALGSLRSLLWIRAQQAQDILLRQGPEQSNQFGEVREMRALAERWKQEAIQESASDEGWSVSPWACELRRTAEANGAQLLVAELPMASAYDAVRQSASGRRIRSRLSTSFCGKRIPWIDATSPEALHDEDFEDGLHLGSAGARRVSRLLGRLSAAEVKTIGTD